MEDKQNEAQASPKQQVAEKIRSSANVLVTVRANPSVDELAAAIGLTLMLNKLDKHATAVFSGQVPSTLEFLKPEETIETNTDSLRDFIVSLDKAKADKLRYKVEENVVKIFITPYRTSITQDDLEFTQGDFNVDIVLALGVTQREELDQAITAHGRILHDATVVTVIAGQKESDIGNINWQDSAASSLSEMLVSISEALQGGLIDSQIATAFLTGIVAETERFSNPKTSPKVMTMAAQLMAAGANQQLIANELQKHTPKPVASQTQDTPKEIVEERDSSVGSDGSLKIGHNDSTQQNSESLPLDQSEQKLPEETSSGVKPDIPKPGNDDSSPFLPPKPVDEPIEAVSPLTDSEVKEDGRAKSEEPVQANQPIGLPELQQTSLQPQEPKEDIHIDHEGNITKPNIAPRHKVIQPLPHDDDQSNSLEQNSYVIDDQAISEQNADAVSAFQPPTELDRPVSQPEVSLPQQSSLPPLPNASVEEATTVLNDNTTLEQIEETVHSPHLEQVNQDVNSARSVVDQIYNQSDFDPARQAQQNIGAMPLGGQLHPGEAQKDQIVEPTNVVNKNQNQQANNDDAPPIPPPFMG